MGTFCGFVALGSTLTVDFLARAGDMPVQATGTPSFLVYDGATLLLSGSANAQATFAITGASNATPIVLTSATSPATGMRVTVAAVGGNTAANATWTVTHVSSTTFSLDSSVGNGAYTSGGTWSITGLYSFSVACTANNGFEAGKTYSMVVEAVVSGVTRAELFTFTVT